MDKDLEQYLSDIANTLDQLDSRTAYNTEQITHALAKVTDELSDVNTNLGHVIDYLERMSIDTTEIRANTRG